MDQNMLRSMWGSLAFRGIVTVLFGIMAVFWPGVTLTTIVYLFGGFILISGIVNLVMGVAHLADGGVSLWARLLILLLGLAEIGVGVYLLRHPLISFATLILIIGITLIVRGLVDLFTGIFGDGDGFYKTIMIIGGLLAGLAGVILLYQPVAGGVAFIWILGLYALISGPLLLALAYEAKKGGPDSSAGAVRTRAAK